MSHPRILVVILSGRKGSGKDEAARFFLHKYKSRHPIKLAYADCLKDTAFDLIRSFYGSNIPVTRDDLDDPVKKETPITGYTFQGEPLTLRRVLQVVGTDIFRKHLGADIWIHPVYEKIRHAVTSTDLVIISDCRFENEVTELRRRLTQATAQFPGEPEYEIACLRINRPSVVADGHASEVQEFDVDVTINNDGTLDQFHQRLDELSLAWVL